MPRRTVWHLLVFALVSVLSAAACSGSPGRGARPARAAAPPASGPYQGLGTWVDVYDFLPAFQRVGDIPAVTVYSVADMARLGVRTLYLQAAQDDPRSAGDIVDTGRVGDLLVAAHGAGMKVVAWYLPHFADVNADLRRVLALHDFRVGNQRFDAIALDIEWTRDVPDPVVRNARLVDLSRRMRQTLPGVALGAIVYPPVLLDVVNPALWPGFPWKQLVPFFDVWLPMSYWTLRAPSSPYHDAARYTTDNIAGVRAAVGAPAAVVHPIGGIADVSSARDVEGFVRAARAGGSTGWSMYDFDTTHSDEWPRLRGQAD
ncbi:MAG: hypothetical protein JOZ99_11815 [Actinobacteria bacterium]|nr:hypothetical protein [Actinomycetota bacterium]